METTTLFAEGGTTFQAKMPTLLSKVTLDTVSVHASDVRGLVGGGGGVQEEGGGGTPY